MSCALVLSISPREDSLITRSPLTKVTSFFITHSSVFTVAITSTPGALSESGLLKRGLHYLQSLLAMIKCNRHFSYKDLSSLALRSALRHAGKPLAL